MVNLIESAKFVKDSKRRAHGIPDQLDGDKMHHCNIAMAQSNSRAHTHKHARTHTHTRTHAHTHTHTHKHAHTSIHIAQTHTHTHVALQVDPVAWRTELERLTPSLSCIHVQESSTSTGFGAWSLRWQKDREVGTGMGCMC